MKKDFNNAKNANDSRTSFDATLLHRFACVDGKQYGYLDAVHFVPFGDDGEIIPTYGFVYCGGETWGAKVVEIERIKPLFSGEEYDKAVKSTAMYVAFERESLRGRLAMNYENDDKSRLASMLNHLDEIEAATY